MQLAAGHRPAAGLHRRRRAGPARRRSPRSSWSTARRSSPARAAGGGSRCAATSSAATRAASSPRPSSCSTRDRADVPQRLPRRAGSACSRTCERARSHFLRRDSGHRRADLRAAGRHVRLAAGGAAGAAVGAVRLHRRRAGAVRARHEPERLDAASASPPCSACRS